MYRCDGGRVCKRNGRWSSAETKVKHEKGTFLVNYMSYCRARWRRRGYTEYITALIGRLSNPGRPTRCFCSPKYPEMLPTPNGSLFTGHRNPFPGVKRLKREVKQLPLSRAEVENEGSNTSNFTPAPSTLVWGKFTGC